MHKYTKETWVGIFVLIGILCTAYLTVKLGKMEFIGDDGYTVQARFTSISGLRSGAEVVMAGVPVGKVTGIGLDQEFGMAVVDIRLPDNIKLSEDVIASIKTSGLIGDKYIKLSPGGSPDTIPPGGTISETESAIDIESLVSKYVFGDVEQ